MHDVKRDSLFEEIKGSKKKHARKKDKTPQEKHGHKNHGHSHSHEHDDHDDHDEVLASKYEGYEHRHVHEDHEEDEHHNDHDHDNHDDEYYEGHEHNHDEEELHEHGEDEHHHEHPKELFHDRAFEHVHEHGHHVLHSHDHVHHKEEIGLTHKWFKNPVRDWFALSVIGLLIAVSALGLVRADLSRGFLVMASVIGIYPLLKNSIIKGILEKRFAVDLVVSLILIIALFYGQIFPVALAVFLILLGSFLRLNFSWNK
ncbi:MAG: hypothetical protein A2042_00580 [Candidatus Schekmanbacteria bacterium GWA2_38_11]|uniref:Heavy metal translocating P-type ATPase n=1 Tax=Candidatus Schekmanbacteria bacterium GWA2_38_11 TaxID=1817876 RepID=A0A1F7RBY0_9BACT|nr:MAG: hypothetical protein A2042_00580 [Candidatus Schekmanbacteria bacterium GWA2_38_11]